MKGKKILIVDDEENIIFALNILLSKSGHEVRHANNGNEAIEQYKLSKPDIILLDIMMPEKDGFETAKIIRELDKDSKTKIIFLTAKGTIIDKMKAYEHGGDDYIIKPYNNKELLDKISTK